LEDYISDIERKVSEIQTQSRHLPLKNSGFTKRPDDKRDQVFVSYSHRDKAWLEKLKSMLRPAIREDKMSFWEDTKIVPGSNWKAEIQTAIDHARAAVLMVSDNYLDSDFIEKDELPLILNAAKEKGLIILWLCLNHCMHEITAINDYRALHDVSQPLESLEERERGSILKHICQRIVETVENAPKNPLS
jgi:hypothetical protein